MLETSNYLELYKLAIHSLEQSAGNQFTIYVVGSSETTHDTYYTFKLIIYYSRKS